MLSVLVSAPPHRRCHSLSNAWFRRFATGFVDYTDNSDARAIVAKLLEWTRAQRFRALSKNVGKVEASEERGHCTGDMAIFLEQQPSPSPPRGLPWSLAVQAIYLRTECSQIFDIG